MKISLGTIVLVALLVLTTLALTNLDNPDSATTVGAITTSRTN